MIPLVSDDEKLSPIKQALLDEKKFQEKLERMRTKAKESEKARKENSDKYYLKDCRGVRNGR